MGVQEDILRVWVCILWIQEGAVAIWQGVLCILAVRFLMLELLLKGLNS